MQERNIEELKTELVEVERQIVDLKKKENGLKNAIAVKISRFAVGDTIEYPYGKSMRKGVVARIHQSYSMNDNPQMDVRTILASGKPGAIYKVQWYDHKKCVLRVKGGAA